MNTPFTNGSVNKPAEVSGMKLPGRTLIPKLIGTPYYFPTGCLLIRIFIRAAYQKIHLTLNMRRDGTPPLLIAVNGLDGSSK
jgi:hypothetical protein